MAMDDDRQDGGFRFRDWSDWQGHVETPADEYFEGGSAAEVAPLTLYANVVRYVREAVWAVDADTLWTIREILQRRMTGERLTQEEIRAAIGSPKAAAQVAQGTVQPGIAILGLRGLLAHRSAAFQNVSGPQGTSAERFTQRLRAAVNDEAVGAIVIDVDSPGGTVDGIPELADEVFRARGSKPIVAVANTIAGSAAYWVAAQADELVVTPSGQVGSIGVMAAHEDRSEASVQKGVKTTLISAGKFKTEGNPFEPLTEEARDALQARVDVFYDMFVKAVARGRGAKVSDVRSGFGQGRMEPAARAVAEGMVDRVATLDETIARLARRRPRRAARAHGHPLRFT